MKKFIAASALAMLMASPSIAQTATPPTTTATPPTTTAPTASPTAAPATDGQYYTTADKSDFLASKLMGARVYATTATVDASKEVDKVTADWKDIGEINNIVVGRDGAVKAVVLGVGGFLSIGEKDVAVRMSELKFVKKAGASTEDYYIVVTGSKESLEKAPAYQRTAG